MPYLADYCSLNLFTSFHIPVTSFVIVLFLWLEKMLGSLFLFNWLNREIGLDLLFSVIIFIYDKSS